MGQPKIVFDADGSLNWFRHLDTERKKLKKRIRKLEARLEHLENSDPKERARGG